jgi:hypothetical protein
VAKHDIWKKGTPIDPKLKNFDRWAPKRANSTALPQRAANLKNNSTKYIKEQSRISKVIFVTLTRRDILSKKKN